MDSNSVTTIIPHIGEVLITVSSVTNPPGEAEQVTWASMWSIFSGSTFLVGVTAGLHWCVSAFPLFYSWLMAALFMFAASAFCRRRADHLTALDNARLEATRYRLS